MKDQLAAMDVNSSALSNMMSCVSVAECCVNPETKTNGECYACYAAMGVEGMGRISQFFYASLNIVFSRIVQQLFS